MNLIDAKFISEGPLADLLILFFVQFSKQQSVDK